MTELFSELPLASAWLFSLIAFVVAALAVAIYPGELSWLPGKGNQWLYDKAAANYANKWQRHSYALYDRQIQQAAAAVAAEFAAKVAANQAGNPRILDIACGSGRATRAAAELLGQSATYTAIDSSSAMLDEMSVTLKDVIGAQAIKRETCDAIEWLEKNRAQFDLLLLMEAVEFIPQNQRLLSGLARAAATGSRLVMTRPASPWWIFFTGRGQSRAKVYQRLTDAGFGEIHFTPWRNRYELVSAIKRA